MGTHYCGLPTWYLAAVLPYFTLSKLPDLQRTEYIFYAVSGLLASCHSGTTDRGACNDERLTLAP